jgi:hypothetical protein
MKMIVASIRIEGYIRESDILESPPSTYRHELLTQFGHLFSAFNHELIYQPLY